MSTAVKMSQLLEATTSPYSSCLCREALLRLRAENAELRGLLKEQTSTEWKEKESADVSGNSSDVQADSKRAAGRGQPKVVDASKVPDEKAAVATALTASSTEWEESPETKGQSHRKRQKQHTVRHGVGWPHKCPSLERGALLE